MSLPLATFDTKGMGSRAAIPSINTDVKLSRGVKSELVFGSSTQDHVADAGLRIGLDLLQLLLRQLTQETNSWAWPIRRSPCPLYPIQNDCASFTAS